MVAGLKELHSLGFVHRDLKPENIVINNERPPKVALIDFDRSLPTSNTCRTGERGTPGYMPDGARFDDGDICLDVYALAAIIVECDMEKDTYVRIADERAGRVLIKKHIEDKGTCAIIAELAKKTVLDVSAHFIPTLDEVEEMIKKIQFRRYK